VFYAKAAPDAVITASWGDLQEIAASHYDAFRAANNFRYTRYPRPADAIQQRSQAARARRNDQRLAERARQLEKG
jgi:hypothetical protein